MDRHNGIDCEKYPLLGAGAHVLVLGSGTGVLALAAAAAGAARVTAVERGRMLYRMARFLLDGNRGVPGAAAVHLVDRRLTAVGVAGVPPPPRPPQGSSVVV